VLRCDRLDLLHSWLCRCVQDSRVWGLFPYMLNTRLHLMFPVNQHLFGKPLSMWSSLALLS
jgi:hypothetical protein